MTLLQLHPLLKPLALLQIVPLRLPHLHRAPQTRLCQLHLKLRLAAQLTKKAWNACSRNQCLSSRATTKHYLNAALVAAFLYLTQPYPECRWSAL